MTEAFIEIRNLKYYRAHRAIFDSVSISVPKGKVVAIMGPSGTGKTTLLRLLGGQLKPDSGDIIVAGHHIPRLTRQQLFQVRKSMGMMFQSGALFTDINVFENVAFPLRIHTELPEDILHDLVLMKLEAVGLRGASRLMPSELSGGMARRVALARAIALDPELIMYDEPFTGLDPIAMGVIVQLIRTLNEAFGMTSIIVSHNIQETASIADHIYVLADGKVIGSGTPDELMRNPSPRVQQFIKGMPDGPVPFHYPATDYREELLSVKG
jgi:phospholipid/cholesterol/gamma-HCH transport system ATP-binding protein